MKREDKMDKSSDRGGDRGGDRDFDRGGAGAGGEKRSFHRRRGCRFCHDSALVIDFKDKYGMQSFISERFKIVPRRVSGACARHQREISIAVKRARHLAFFPYSPSQA